MQRNRKPSPWPADSVERRAVAELEPHARNARTHSEEQVSQIAAAIEEWGWTTPVLIDEDGGIIAGHGRILAARKLGLEDVPAVVARGWSDDQKRAYVVADNQLALNAGWDMAMLAAELGDLGEVGFDMSLIGFTNDELKDIATRRDSGNTDPDEAPDAPTDPATELGDLWICGDHRVRCGDSTSADDVRALLGDSKPHLMVTDPPYGVDYDPAWRERDWKGARSVGKVDNDDRADWSEAWALFPGDVAYVWHAGTHASTVDASLASVGLLVRNQIIWAKQHFVISRGHYHPQHEPCWYAVRKGRKAHWRGDRKQATVWNITNATAFGGSREGGNEATGHGTQKPVECCRRPILNNSKPDDGVYDPFLGSGTTMIAASMEGRRCFGMELNPAYCDVIVKRWQAFTNEKATLEGDGRTFNEIATARGKDSDAATGQEADADPS